MLFAVRQQVEPKSTGPKTAHKMMVKLTPGSRPHVRERGAHVCSYIFDIFYANISMGDDFLVNIFFVSSFRQKKMFVFSYIDIF